MPSKAMPASKAATSSTTFWSVASSRTSTLRMCATFDAPTLNSRVGQISASSISPMVWPVLATTRRSPSTSSPKNSTRTGAAMPAPKMSTVSPATLYVPGPSTSSSRS